MTLAMETIHNNIGRKHTAHTWYSSGFTELLPFHSHKLTLLKIPVGNLRGQPVCIMLIKLAQNMEKYEHGITYSFLSLCGLFKC